MLFALLGLPTESYALAVWVWFTALIGIVWLRRHLDLNRAAREPLLTEADAAGDATDLPPLSMIVAAKDEQANIERCARGLLAQDYPKLRLILVNDRSTDQTGTIIDRLAAEDARVIALHVTDLPAGWFGKNNAMRVGVAHADGDWLCFSDADCTFHSRKLVAAAVRFARREQVDFLSVLPRLEALSFWERVIQPVAGGVLVFWFPPQKVNNPRSRVAYANGAFMLMSRSAYQRLGGHEAVKATLNEDMHFARRAKECGVRLRVVRSADLYSVRMYTGLREIWRGWTRIFFGCFGTPARLLGSVALLTLFSLSPYVTLISALTSVVLGGGPIAGAALLASGWAVAAQQSVLWRYYPVSGLPSPLAVTYPLGAAFSLAMTINAIGRALGARTTWRGTTYQGG